jgi:hypothetical protein
MNPIYKLSLKSLRKINTIIYPDSLKFGRNWKMFPNKEYASDLIRSALMSDNPVMIARVGANESACVANYLGVRFPEKYKNPRSYIKGQTPAWWWEPSVIDEMQKIAGFFPATVPHAERFSQLMLEYLPNIDILGSWLKDETFYEDKLTRVKRVMLEDLEPFFTDRPWTMALKGKKVLVVHPFADTIQQQFLVRDKIFENGLLPDFELTTVKAVQTLAGEDKKSPFRDWFEALDHMKEQIGREDYDICILGCGAYGLPLASFVKKSGKKAIHLGGVTQLLFGIKGKRWENYVVYPYKNLYNEYWVRPGQAERPKNAQIVEGAAYW